MRGVLIFIWELIKIVILALIIVIPVRLFIFQPFIVEGASMRPNFHSGDYLIVDELSYRFSEPKRGDVIVFKYPRNPKKKFIKRIIGLPGEIVEVKDNKVIITQGFRKITLEESSYLPSDTFTPDSPPIPLGKDEYFVLGDNRNHSFDSEDWGVLPRKYIIGKVVLRLWPLWAFTKVEKPKYPSLEEEE